MKIDDSTVRFITFLNDGMKLYLFVMFVAGIIAGTGLIILKILEYYHII